MLHVVLLTLVSLAGGRHFGLCLGRSVVAPQLSTDGKENVQVTNACKTTATKMEQLA